MGGAVRPLSACALPTPRDMLRMSLFFCPPRTGDGAEAYMPLSHWADAACVRAPTRCRRAPA